MDAYNESLVRSKIDVLFTFNHPDNPMLVTKGAGIVPKQVEWVLDELGWEKTLPNIVYVTGMIMYELYDGENVLAQYAYTLDNEEIDDGEE